MRPGETQQSGQLTVKRAGFLAEYYTITDECGNRLYLSRTEIEQIARLVRDDEDGEQ